MFWDNCRVLRNAVWIDRVPTDMNPADGPSRGTIDEDCEKYGWERVQPVVPDKWLPPLVTLTPKQSQWRWNKRQWKWQGYSKWHKAKCQKTQDDFKVKWTWQER